jgi:Ran GTPase-activating protein (RanGAP) involved in mRNA processing and transport
MRCACFHATIQTALTYLSLRDGSLEDKGVKAIARSLKAPKLTSLDLSANDCTAAAAKHVTKALKALPELTYLGLEVSHSEFYSLLVYTTVLCVLTAYLLWTFAPGDLQSVCAFGKVVLR